MAMSDEEKEKLGNQNFILLGCSYAFLFLACWFGAFPFILIGGLLVLLIRLLTKPHPLDYEVDSTDLSPYTRKGVYWNALQIWLLSAVVLVPIVFVPGFCRTEAIEYEEQNFFSRTTPKEWFETGNSYKADSRTIRRVDESCYDGQVLWSIENQPFTSFMRLTSVAGFLYFLVGFLLIRPKHKKQKAKKRKRAS